MISPVYKGHGGTRIVTIEAYNAYRKEQLAKIDARLAEGFQPVK